MLPDAARAQLQQLANVSRETLERLDIYEKLLLEQSKTLNLIGKNTESQIWDRHFLDSAQLWPFLHEDDAILDMGSGAGFPGMVLAILGARHVHLAENNQKKIAFLKNVARATDTKIQIHGVKVEVFPNLPISILTSRALANVSTLLAMASRFLAQGAEALFLKGQKALEEINEAKRLWAFDVETRPSVTEPTASIVRLSNVRKL